MLDLEVVPEKSLGNEKWEFVLGMPFYQAVNILRRQSRVIQDVQVWYSNQTPLRMDLIIYLLQNGIRLIFDPVSQRLKIIEVNNMKKVQLKYCGIHFNTNKIPPTLLQINQSFGATHQGVYNSEKQAFVLSYRGVSFDFPVTPNCEPCYAYDLRSMKFSDYTSLIVSRMYIVSDNSLQDARAPPLPITSYHGNCLIDCLEVIRENQITKALKFSIFAEDKEVGMPLKKIVKRLVKFGDCPNDVISALGCPEKVFFKSDVKMKIHTLKTKGQLRAKSSDYFYNYFKLGVDILFDSNTHLVKKFVLHTNYPGHYDFNIYCRCAFKIPFTIAREKSQFKAHAFEANMEELIVTSYTKWDKVHKFLVRPNSNPAILNRTSASGASNLFGSTHCFGVQDMIFEVMQNQHIAAVTIYNQKSTATVATH